MLCLTLSRLLFNVPSLQFVDCTMLIANLTSYNMYLGSSRNRPLSAPGDHMCKETLQVRDCRGQ